VGDERLWIIGAGRVGLALGLVLADAGGWRLSYTGRRSAAPRHPLFDTDPPAADYSNRLALPPPSSTSSSNPLASSSLASNSNPPASPLLAPTAIVIAVPDAALPSIAASLAALALPSGIPIIHTSGAVGSEALEPLAEDGFPTGSMHPLAAVSDPVSGADRLRGAWYAIEGAPDAVRLAEAIVAATGGRSFAIARENKPLYHAAAVLASNYVVALLAAAERLAREAGVPPEAAAEALPNLASGSAENSRGGPAKALTGPIARGDVGTVASHLARLSGPDRALYSVLARETLALARSAGLDEQLAVRVEGLLEADG
jgi:predicted short-subunit dehydrogenase-like oxidoreductase (DUF2520 family)